ncbi:MAG: hypothetical protein N3A62_06905 [Thermodesulfovibrionales bacterium]|nr:hypothetical protein [Thermodesulfovibrionales bacterium]
MEDEIKKLLLTMHDLTAGAETCMSNLQTALIYNSSNTLKDCFAKVEEVKRLEPELSKRLSELSKSNPKLKPYESVPMHILKIYENIEKLSIEVEKKIKDNILFSDKAMTEVTFLLQRLIDILRPTADIILAKNAIVRRYVEESRAGIVRRAIEYATLHEERLIEGLCLQVASSIYLNMLDAIKSIAWHAKEITVNLVEWSLPRAV